MQRFALVLALSVLTLSPACRREEPVVTPAVITPGVVGTALARPVVVANTPPGVVGRWQGVGQQSDGSSWDMDVEIFSTSAGVCAKVDYPTVPCKAEWVCEKMEGGTLLAEERLTDGKNRCIDRGRMTMELTQKGTLSWSWELRGASAQAELSRSGPQR